MSIIDDAFSASCKDAEKDYHQKKLPKNYEEFKGRVLLFFDGRTSSMKQRISSVPPYAKGDFENTAKLVKKDFEEGNRPDLEKKVKESYERLLKESQSQ